jgi:hypothetical protein
MAQQQQQRAAAATSGSGSGALDGAVEAPAMLLARDDAYGEM